MTKDDAARPRTRAGLPGLTACSLCAGETLGATDAQDGGQLARLRELAAGGVARLTLVECLDECERGDVVVVHPCAAERRRAVRPMWFERLAGEVLSAELRTWLEAGGPGRSEPPAALQPLRITHVDASGT
ncbi:hypothetical protein [Cellulomonas sp. KRMCY2]|uniref:hypothetical protein n=1 Tax=Cellulomonas sp. KRMCY2 TaxID=1304865 RepID=UPI00045E6808|nr:hypothetical protein [Cellulomonas sp. KRMCY2]